MACNALFDWVHTDRISITIVVSSGLRVTSKQAGWLGEKIMNNLEEEDQDDHRSHT